MLRPLSVALVLAAAGSSFGQAGDSAAPAAPSYLVPADEVLQLEKFEVSALRELKLYTVERTQTATKTDTALVNIPQAMSVVTREFIDDQAMTGIASLARYVPGMGIAQGEGNRDTPVMRGNSTTADFFVDGIRDDVQYTRDLYNVDRVEVMKGPNAMIFGRGGSGGILNRVTKQANGATAREVTLQVGSWEQYRATLDVAQKVNGAMAVRLTGLYEEAESYRDGFELKRYGVNPTLAFALTRRTALRVGYEHFSDERTADRGVSSFQGRPLRTEASTYFGDPTRSPVWAQVNTVFATLDHRFANGIALRNSARFGGYRKFYQNVFPGAVNAAGTAVTISAYSQRTERDNVFNQTEVIIPFASGPVKHELLGGLELGRQTTDNVRLTGYFTSVSATTTSVSAPLSEPRTALPLSFQPSATDANNHGVAETAAVFVQDQIALLPRLHAIAGVRWERFAVDFRNNRTGALLDSRDDLISPRAGLIWKPAPNLAVYTSTSMSNLPRAGEQLASLTLTNRSLEPEKFQNREIGVKWDIHPDLALTAAVYRLTRENVVISDPADPTRSLLVDGQQVEGFEFGWTGRMTKRWSVVGGYAYQEGTIKTTQSATALAGARLAQLPKHTFSLWNRYNFSRAVGVGLGTIYRDEIFASTDNTVTLPSFVRFDAAIFVRISPRVQAQVNVENVLDRHYYAMAHSNSNITPGSPRAVRVSFTTRF